MNERTGRIHTSFNQTVAATGRLSSSDQNLQNIPIRTDIGREIRNGFVAESTRLVSRWSQQVMQRYAPVRGCSFAFQIVKSAFVERPSLTLPGRSLG